FNRLVGSSRAIVSDIPGTTRDVISAQLDINGYLVNLSDTAGIRDAADEIEKIGIERTHAQIENADLIINVQSTECRAQLEPKQNEIIVINKSDLARDNCTLHSVLCTHVSALTGAGIDKLLDLIKQKIHEQLDGAESEIAVNARTREQLIIARDELKAGLSCHLSHVTCHDLFSEHIRRAADAIGRILGTIDASEIMDATFSQLCLGK
ncbi:MAG: GTP-binding protein, partial [Rickettsiales bacterium]|nr:GTP-binding protein [Rickettsiales bacterium]